MDKPEATPWAQRISAQSSSVKVYPLPSEHFGHFPIFPECLLFEVAYRNLHVMATTEKQQDGRIWRRVQFGHPNGAQPTWFEALDIRRRLFRNESRVFMEIPWVRDPRAVRIGWVSLYEEIKEVPVEAGRPEDAAAGLPLPEEKVPDGAGGGEGDRVGEIQI